MLRRTLAALAALLVGAVAAITLASPAQAASCAYPLMCGYDASNWQGKQFAWNPELMADGCYNIGTEPSGFDWNDKIDSVFYNDYWDFVQVQFFRNYGCTGLLVTQVRNDGTPYNTLRACTQPQVQWDGNCGNSLISAFRVWHYYPFSGLRA